LIRPYIGDADETEGLYSPVYGGSQGKILNADNPVFMMLTSREVFADGRVFRLRAFKLHVACCR